MVAIRSISFTNNRLVFIDGDNIPHSFSQTDIPQGILDALSLENYLNTQWLPQIINGEHQMQVHVFSFSPLSLTTICANNDVQIQANWWQPVNETDVTNQQL